MLIFVKQMLSKYDYLRQNNTIYQLFSKTMFLLKRETPLYDISDRHFICWKEGFYRGGLGKMK